MQPRIPTHTQSLPSRTYLFAPIHALLVRFAPTNDRRVFEIGCGNGAMAFELSKKGFSVTGVDPSTASIALANKESPQISLHLGSAYDELASIYGRFPIVLSLEVMEHLYDPRAFARSAFDLLLPGGKSILSTPYHGYWKNLAIALFHRFDRHDGPLWDHGHIKFWSERTLTSLLVEAGFAPPTFLHVGRAIPAFAKSMIAVARKPASLCGKEDP